MKKQTLVVIVTVAMLLLLLSAGNGNLLAGPPTPEKMTVTGNARNAFTYQGRLTDTSGKPLNGQYNMNFQLWDALTNGNQVGNDILVNGVVVENGVFNAVIPVPDGTFNGQALWLRIQVGSEWLEPRQEIMSVPYAMSLVPGASVQGAATFDVISAVNTNMIGGANGVYGESSSPAGAGINGYNTSTNGGWGVLGQTHAVSGEAAGVAGTSHATTGNSSGVQGQAYSPNAAGVAGYNDSPIGGWGVLGQINAADGAGVAGTNFFTSTETGNPDGIRGISYSPDGAGVRGYNESTTGGYAIVGIVNGPNNVGVAGFNDATGDWALGIYGQTKSSEGMAIMGVNEATTGWARGVDGESHSPDGIGVAGINHSGGIGVYASTTTTGTAMYAKSGDIIFRGVNITDSQVFMVDANGYVYADGAYNCGLGAGSEPGTCIVQNNPADFAEMLPAVVNLEPGDVLVIGADGKLTRSTQPYQTAVAGVYSTQPGYLGGGQHLGKQDFVPLAIVGVVPVKVSAENSPIHPGDLLTPSATPGYAMVCQNRLDCVGAIIGKALEPLEEGTGMITVLITLQ